jgi:hypothetical protein
MEDLYVTDFYDIRTAKGIEAPDNSHTEEVIVKLVEISEKLYDWMHKKRIYLPQEKCDDADEVWALCNTNSRAPLYAPSNPETPDLRTEKWAVPLRRCLYYIVSTAVPHQKHKLQTLKAIRVHPTVVHMLKNSETLLRVDPVQDGMQSSFACKIIEARVTQPYYREFIPYYAELNNDGGINFLETTAQGTGYRVSRFNEVFQHARLHVRTEMLTGAQTGVIVRFVRGNLNGSTSRGHMICALFYNYHAYIFDTNTTGEDSAKEVFKTWKPLLQTFIRDMATPSAHLAHLATPPDQIKPIPKRLHGIEIKDMGDDGYIAGSYWYGGVGFHIGPQPGNGDCQRATSNIISRLLTTVPAVAPFDFYVNKKIQFNWSWTLLDAVANAYDYIIDPALIFQTYKKLIQLYRYTRHDHIGAAKYVPVGIDELSVQARRSLSDGYNPNPLLKVFRYDTTSTPPQWIRATRQEFEIDPYMYTLYATNDLETIYYRLIPEHPALSARVGSPSFTIGKRQVFVFTEEPTDQYQAVAGEGGELKLALIGGIDKYTVWYYSSSWQRLTYNYYISHRREHDLYVVHEDESVYFPLVPVQDRPGVFTLGEKIDTVIMSSAAATAQVAGIYAASLKF